jgi:hypothetical protein
VFVVAGSGFAAAGALLFFWPRREPVNVVPSVGRSGASLQLTGTF